MLTQFSARAQECALVMMTSFRRARRQTASAAAWRPVESLLWMETSIPAANPTSLTRARNPRADPPRPSRRHPDASRTRFAQPESNPGSAKTRFAQCKSLLAPPRRVLRNQKRDPGPPRRLSRSANHVLTTITRESGRAKRPHGPPRRTSGRVKARSATRRQESGYARVPRRPEGGVSSRVNPASLRTSACARSANLTARLHTAPSRPSTSTEAETIASAGPDTLRRRSDP